MPPSSGPGPRVTIVTPSFGQGATLGETIRSVIDQDWPDLEYFVLDGGSTDGSVDVIREHDARLDWWTSGPDGGQTDAIATGWSRSTGSILAWLNADDFYLPGAVRRAAEVFAARPEVALVYGNCISLDATTGRTRMFDARPMTLRECLLRRGVIPQPAAFVRADAVRAIGGLDRELRYVMDFDLWIRVLARWPAAFVDGPPLATYRFHRAAKSARDTDGFAHELLAVLDRFFERDAPGGAISARNAAAAVACIAGARGAYLTRRDLRRTMYWFGRAAVRDPVTAFTALLRSASRLARPLPSS